MTTFEIRRLGPDSPEPGMGAVVALGDPLSGDRLVRDETGDLAMIGIPPLTWLWITGPQAGGFVSWAGLRALAGLNRGTTYSTSGLWLLADAIVRDPLPTRTPGASFVHPGEYDASAALDVRRSPEQ